MEEFDHLKKHISQTFKISGYAIRSDSSIFLAEQLIALSAVNRKKWLANITANIQNQGLETPNIEKKHIELAIKECGHMGLEDNETTFNVINAFDIPKYVYNNERKKFMLDNKPKGFLPSANAKADYIRERYTLLWQRTSRHELFTGSNSLEKTADDKKYKLSKIEILLSTSKPIEVVVLGYLTQLTEGKFYLEDPTGVVQLDLAKAKFHSGLFCEGCFVLADGRYVDGILKVTGMGFPPPEAAPNSRTYFGTANTWGGTAKTLLKYSAKLAEVEKTNVGDTIVFLSDCWLDNQLVLDKLKLLFIGYNDFPPIAIVMMGPFSKRNEDPYALKAKFNTLSNLLSSCERLKRETDLVLIPAAEDPSSANILPRPPIPECLVNDLKKQLPRVILATNPCRLQYCTQQIVVCRADLLTKFCRNTIKFPKEGLLEEHFARTLISQGTLSPLHPIAQPVFWQYDAALSLYPLPDLIVIGDPSKGFQTTFRDCTVMNTGSFPKSNFAFKVYIPSSKTVEDSQVPDEE